LLVFESSVAECQASFESGKGADEEKISTLTIRVYDDAGKVTETHEHKGDFKEP